jgi:hypothetical protein
VCDLGRYVSFMHCASLHIQLEPVLIYLLCLGPSSLKEASGGWVDLKFLKRPFYGEAMQCC